MPTVARPLRAAVALALAALTAAALPGTDASGEPPGAAAAGPSTPELSETSRLADRRSLVVGDRAYAMSTADGLYPAAGWHIRGEMGGVWTPPIKLVDGVWLRLADQWLGDPDGRGRHPHDGRMGLHPHVLPARQQRGRRADRLRPGRRPGDAGGAHPHLHARAGPCRSRWTPTPS